MNQIEKFIQSGERNRWVKEGKIHVYLRKAKRFVEGDYQDFLDIGSVEIPEKYWNQGIFTKFLDDILTTYPTFNIYVESIMNPTFNIYVESIMNPAVDANRNILGENENIYFLRK